MTSFGSNHSCSGSGSGIGSVSISISSSAVFEEPTLSVSILSFSLSSPFPAPLSPSPPPVCPSPSPSPSPAAPAPALAVAVPGLSGNPAPPGKSPPTPLVPFNSGNGSAWQFVGTPSPTNSCPKSPFVHGTDHAFDPPLFDDSSAVSNYRSWIVRHPSALKFFDRIIEAANGKKVAVFLDYDGTLSPIVDNPDRAFMSDKMREAVKAVAGHFPTAIISGRCRQKVYDFVQLPELYYAGSHGMDIMGPASNANATMANGTRAFDEQGNEVVLFQLSSDLTSTIEDVCRELNEKTRIVDGVRIENNKFCATVHFRCVKEEDWDLLAEMVDAIVQFYPNLYLTQGRKVLEIRPTIAWNKGKALEFLLDSLGLGDEDDVFPIYIGDDRTDEDAFKVLNDKGGQGLSILVSSTPKDSMALCSLCDPCEVMEFLRRLVNWRVNQMLNVDWHL